MVTRRTLTACGLAVVLIGCWGNRSRVAWAEPLPGTKPLTLEQPLDVVMVDGIDRFALREIAASVERRARFWKRDFSGRDAYEQSIAANREHLRTILGVVDLRVEPKGIEMIGTNFQSPLVARGPSCNVLAVRWQVLPGVTAEGLLLQPGNEPVARVIALPDADWTPEMLAGLAGGVRDESQLARILVEYGCQVLVPTLISRDDAFSGNPDVRFTNQPHREFIYRQAFEMGRHVIGYEVEKVLAAVDQFAILNDAQKKDIPIAVAGIGEGGLLAFYSAAVDPRIKGALVSGYFGPREELWQEPIYRNVWALLREFGDAEIASLIAPRPLVVEAAAAPELSGPPAPKPNRGGAAPGRIVTPKLADVEREFRRAAAFYDSLHSADQLALVASGRGDGPAASSGAVTALLKRLGISEPLREAEEAPQDSRHRFDPQERQKRQFDELVEYTQKLVRHSARIRDALWLQENPGSLPKWQEMASVLRDFVYEEMIGRLPAPTIEPNVRTRRAFEEPGFIACEVVIDVYPDVIAGGILLLPRDLKPGEKRPVVVCQHGLEGVPMDVISRDKERKGAFEYYSGFAAELADRGFITFAPQNPYRGGDRFRTLQRKSNPLKRSLFSYIIPQHQRTIDFLKTLPNVDPSRIAFYGLSYGGKTAVRVPPLLADYCLSICSADFNEWVVKNTTVESGTSYMFTGEYEIFEWNMGHVANYAELSSLMTPRPFMVERGHRDGVAPDEWVAWEYSKVRRHYDELGLGDKTEIEFFNGPHKINGVGTYAFLHKHLAWPAPRGAGR